jgi:hypothetical protein
MVIRLKTASPITRMLSAMEANRAQRERLRLLLMILQLLRDPGPGQAPDLVSVEFEHITSSTGQKCWETYRVSDPDPPVAWRVRWYFDSDVIWVFDVEA